MAAPRRCADLLKAAGSASRVTGARRRLSAPRPPPPFYKPSSPGSASAGGLLGRKPPARAASPARRGPRCSHASPPCSSRWYSPGGTRLSQCPTAAAAASASAARNTDGKTTGGESKPFYVSTPIFYVNAVPHIGHLYSVVLADTLARYEKLKGRNVTFSSGTDEHGLKIQQAANAANAAPLNFTDSMSAHFRRLCTAAQIDLTDFIRTTEPRHHAAVETLWTRIQRNGYFYKDKYDGWYSVQDESFLMPNQVTTVLDPSTGKKCTMAIGSGHLVEWASEVTYKFRLSKFTDDLRRWLSDTPEVILPKERKYDVLNLLKTPLEDLSVSRPRSRLSWGIPVPNDDSQVVYVWLDALASYLTVSGYPDFGSEAGLSPTSPWPADVHIVGKDILRFHAIYWPAFLLAAGLPLPRRIVAHAHWMMDHHKMSKSRGNVVDPFAELELYGAETVRLYLMRFGPMANDCNYDRAELAVRYKKDLQAQVGNLLQRTTSVAVNPNQVYPAKPSQICHEDDILFREKVESLLGHVDGHFSACRVDRALECIFDALAETNRYVQQTAPWDLAKRRDQDPSTGLRLRQVLYHALEVLRVSGTFLQAVLPCKAETLLDRLGVPRDRRGAADATLDSLADDGERDLGDRGAVLFPPIK